MCDRIQVEAEEAPPAEGWPFVLGSIILELPKVDLVGVEVWLQVLSLLSLSLAMRDLLKRSGCVFETATNLAPETTLRRQVEYGFLEWLNSRSFL